jgi:hypothetical protein
MMAQRRSVFDQAFPVPSSMMTPKGGSQQVYGEPAVEPVMESKDTFRRRTTPVVGEIEPKPSTLQEILAMLNGVQ